MSVVGDDTNDVPDLESLAGREVLVVGGLPTACYVADTGGDVTLLERTGHVGGRAGRPERDGFRFDTGPSWYLMPDLFEDFFAHFGRSPPPIPAGSSTCPRSVVPRTVRDPRTERFVAFSFSPDGNGTVIETATSASSRSERVARDVSLAVTRATVVPVGRWAGGVHGAGHHRRHRVSRSLRATVTLEWRLPAAAGNEVQSDGASADFEFVRRAA